MMLWRPDVGEFPNTPRPVTVTEEVRLTSCATSSPVEMLPPFPHGENSVASPNVVTHAELTHAEPEGQTRHVAPQALLSFVVFAHVPLHWTWPGAQGSGHDPEEQDWPAAQAAPQAPQLSGSVWRSTSQPFVSVPSQ